MPPLQASCSPLQQSSRAWAWGLSTSLPQQSSKAARLPERSTWLPGWWEPVAVTEHREGTHCSGSRGQCKHEGRECFGRRRKHTQETSDKHKHAGKHTHRAVRTRGVQKHTNRFLRLGRATKTQSVPAAQCAAVATVPPPDNNTN